MENPVCLSKYLLRSLCIRMDHSARFCVCSSHSPQPRIVLLFSSFSLRYYYSPRLIPSKKKPPPLSFNFRDTSGAMTNLTTSIGQRSDINCKSKCYPGQSQTPTNQVVMPDLFVSFASQKPRMNPFYECIKFESEAWISG